MHLFFPGFGLSYGIDQIFEQAADVIAPARGNAQNLNSDGSDAAGGGNRRRRAATIEQETLMEKRQRRMIRNRASAQRSRARKQVSIDIFPYKIKCNEFLARVI